MPLLTDVRATKNQGGHILADNKRTRQEARALRLSLMEVLAAGIFDAEVGATVKAAAQANLNGMSLEREAKHALLQDHRRVLKDTALVTKLIDVAVSLRPGFKKLHVRHIMEKTIIGALTRGMKRLSKSSIAK